MIDIEKLFFDLNIDSDYKKQTIRNALDKYNIDLSLLYFINSRMSINGQSFPYAYLDGILQNFTDKGIHNRESALIYFKRQEAEEEVEIKLQDIIKRFESTSLTQLSDNEKKRLGRLQFEYNIDYNLLDHALDIAELNDKMSINYIEGIIRNWTKRDIHNMFDLMDSLAVNKKWRGI